MFRFHVAPRHLCPRLAIAIALLALFTIPIAAQESQEAPGAFQVVSGDRADAPTRIGVKRSLPSLATLATAAIAEPDRLATMLERNRRGELPLQQGFLRTFPSRELRLSAGGAPVLKESPLAGGLLVRREGSLIWTARVAVEGAWAFRLRLRDVVLPPGAKIWVYGADGVALGPFGRELIDPENGIWLPAVAGDDAYLEIRLPEESLLRGEARFTLGEVMELFDVLEDHAALDFGLPAPGDKVWTACDIDATCVGSGTFGSIADYYHAVARLSFVVGGSGFLCSGGLVNDTDPNGFRPFLLTANHCFDTQSSASSLTAYFDYRSSTCNGPAPSLGSVPSVSGSTLLATNAGSDFTFVELSANPAGVNYYLGWTTATPPGGSTMYRISHPAGTAQKFSTSTFNASGGITCAGFSRSNFHYSSGATGSTTGGSSGAPTVNASGQILGQLFGVCHFANWDDCSYGTYNYIDGAFGATFPSISQWLDPQTPSCVDDVFEDDDTCFGGPVNLGVAQSHLHCDEDWVFFPGTAGSTYRIETSSLVGGADTTLALHFECGAQLAFDDDGGVGIASRIEWTAQQDGFYDVRIQEFADNYVNGEGYDVTVTCIANCGATFADGFETGDTSAWSVTVP